jgi:hypothetical protein
MLWIETVAIIELYVLCLSFLSLWHRFLPLISKHLGREGSMKSHIMKGLIFMIFIFTAIVSQTFANTIVPLNSEPGGSSTEASDRSTIVIRGTIANVEEARPFLWSRAYLQFFSTNTTETITFGKKTMNRVKISVETHGGYDLIRTNLWKAEIKDDGSFAFVFDRVYPGTSGLQSRAL